MQAIAALQVAAGEAARAELDHKIVHALWPWRIAAACSRTP